MARDRGFLAVYSRNRQNILNVLAFLFPFWIVFGVGAVSRDREFGRIQKGKQRLVSLLTVGQWQTSWWKVPKEAKRLTPPVFGQRGQNVSSQPVFSQLGCSRVFLSCVCYQVRVSGIFQFRTETCWHVILGREPEVPGADDTRGLGPDSAASQRGTPDHLRSINYSNAGTRSL